MSVKAHPQTLPFSIKNAFTDRLEGGNPAAIVRVPSLTALPDTTLQTIATNFNQPITVFVAPHETSDASETATFGIRWFTPEVELPLCGHGTSRQPRRNSAARRKAHEHRVEDGRIEIDLDAGRAEALVGAEDAQLREVLARALGKDVPVKYIGRGMDHLDYYVLIEVETHDLKGLKVNIAALRDSPFYIHVVVAPSTIPGLAFESRMFAPRAGLPEDPVCGSAHTLSTPYWMTTKELSGVVNARQVSSRVGDLKIQFDAAEQRIKLEGKVKAVSQGELFV
ncbi:hypothetical protein EI94DRAFT_1830838 [Lactarius quietus]|nr:hypothetical protein EI94DRAFT_1830838 [Lactarius quietus]